MQTVEDFHALQQSRSTTEPSIAKNQNEVEPYLRHVFQKRREHLLERCRSLKINNTLNTQLWHSFLTIETPGSLQVCVPPKAGSTSWRKLSQQLTEQTHTNRRPVSAILVRHPLSRLTSVYRDKYLDGSPISFYNREWRNRTGTTTMWKFYWSTYWLPTLVSSGRLDPPKNFLEGLKQGAGSDKSHIPGIRTLRDAVIRAFGHINDELMRRFNNAFFTFEEFLEFVVWTNNLGIVDVHWAPYTEQCLPCQKDYRYILHLETIQEESRILLSLDIQSGFISQHRTKDTYTPLQDDFHYYKDLPETPAARKSLKGVHPRSPERHGMQRDASLRRCIVERLNEKRKETQTLCSMYLHKMRESGGWMGTEASTLPRRCEVTCYHPQAPIHAQKMAKFRELNCFVRLILGSVPGSSSKSFQDVTFPSQIMDSRDSCCESLPILSSV
ncbi:uncharacterized protein LOC122260289 [Penaeus japonicus]|uniref:uncharacterized protein LOC122260289 n=1 Tax=Penaeus japonicus TaxID=27405 RepID=UPI001C7156B9|nr:uncharacterized protein LOC122260289 [Penaeus japonicus]